VILKGLYMSIH